MIRKVTIEMRTQKTIMNVVMNLLLQLITIASGLILPRLILSVFGSRYNGLTTSITQFLACAVLLRSGLGGATRAALYKPLANKDHREVSAIINATDKFMKKVALILIISIILFATIYPTLLKDEFSWIFTFTLFLIISISTFAESFWGITYLILVQADQKLWISSVFKMISIIFYVIIASILILNNFSIHIVKLGSAMAFCIHPILLNIYVKRKYKIDSSVKPNNVAISQRWEAFWHQISTFINNNTDVIVLTIFLNVLEVSVYSIYNMILDSLKNLVLSFSNGIEAAFGNMIAKNEKESLKENLNIIEYIIYSISTIAYAATFILIIDFVRIYTNGINDVNYIRYTFAYILTIANLLYCIRIPYQLIIQAAGHYKQTRNGAILEAIINVTISICLVIKFGLLGVAVGTLIATIFRTTQLAYYALKNIVKTNFGSYIYKCIISFIQIIIIICIVNVISLTIPMNYWEWIIKAICTGIISVIVVTITTFVCYKKEFKLTMSKIKNVLKGRNKMENNSIN